MPISQKCVPQNGIKRSTVNQQKHLDLMLSANVRCSARIDKILTKPFLLYEAIRCTFSRKALTYYAILSLKQDNLAHAAYSSSLGQYPIG